MDVSVRTTSYGAEKRGWLQGDHGTGPGDTPSITLDISTFTAGTHYPNGYIPSGTVVCKITASGLFGPYDSGAADGRQTPAAGAVFLLFNSVPVASGQTRDLNAGFMHGFVESARLPFQSGSGSAAAAGKTAMPLVAWL